MPSPEKSKGESWMNWFSNFQDDQRIERLQTHCHQLDELLKQCRETGKSSTEDVEGSGLPLRNIKFFDWRGITKDHPEIENACAREEHLVWACRAVSIGCGRELGVLKTCFQAEGSHTILTAEETAYEKGPLLKRNIPCRNLQEELGGCVASGAHELYERKRGRRTQGKENN
jgi:hypothetical protein